VTSLRYCKVYPKVRSLLLYLRYLPDFYRSILSADGQENIREKKVNQGAGERVLRIIYLVVESGNVEQGMWMKDAKDGISTHVTVTLQYHPHTTHTSVAYNCKVGKVSGLRRIRANGRQSCQVCRYLLPDEP
jgi:hypothetical protein